MTRTPVPAAVYLIHFDRPYAHAKHYVGYTALESVADRITRHRNGHGARLLQVVTQSGIGWDVRRIWNFPTIKQARDFERRLKLRAATRHCPVCNPKAMEKQYHEERTP